ncbi:zinc-finger double domain-containing protein [Phthorimaea operculella]|nr:zinc-finger double domain-containing protein [Phthorimaea operculella]
MTGHGVNRRYHCTECSYSTIYSQTLVNHMRRHNGEKPYQCHCGKRFTQAGSLATHDKTHSNEMAHICSTCGKQFRHAFSLKKHQLVHKAGQFTCNICQKNLKTEVSLTAHMNRHYNIRNYSCEECGDMFVTSTDLINHRKTHSSEKTAECHLCDYKTKSKKNLVTHLKRHAGEKSFECDICSKTAYTRSDLRRHMRVHSREKPYPCGLCAQRFSQPGSLNHHVRNLHGVADYRWGRASSMRRMAARSNTSVVD